MTQRIEPQPADYPPNNIIPFPNTSPIRLEFDPRPSPHLSTVLIIGALVLLVIAASVV